MLSLIAAALLADVGLRVRSAAKANAEARSAERFAQLGDELADRLERSLVPLRFSIGLVGDERCVVGVLTNTGPFRCPRVTVRFNLYDAQGMHVASTADSTESLDAFTAWQFAAPVTSSKVETAKLVDVSVR